ncbi:hypothetical protein EOI86_22815 [Hwanghaeella grinnelliae]|uniref:NHLP bacteriocin system secretion protein n=1 Tax=Hwanghaeella grinnelliae TaxID=2500179 RepID=A0A437QI12_9PROT|nr:hypothetical protein [Hwanghaeella grinnelliae]RVU33960.1 hypothetical protein EOI86_22815 [Hwanghaeella grinnelliae]
MFRKKALEKMHEPESLDQLLVVVTPRSVWILASLAGVLVVALAWGFLSRIPVTVDGFGILVRPGSIKQIQSIGNGSVVSVRKDIGSLVNPGELIAIVNNPDQERRLDVDIAKYQSLRAFTDRTLEISARKRDLELELVNDTVASIEADRNSLMELRSRLSQQTGANAQKEIQSLEKNRKLLLNLYESQKKQLEDVTELVREGAVSDSQRLQLQATLTETENRLSELSLRRNSTDLRSIDNEQQDLRLKQEIEQLDAALQQEFIKRQRIEQDYDFEIHSKSVELNELSANIRLTKERQYRQQNVRSPYKGRTLEVSTSVGTNLGSGERVAILQIDSVQPFKRLVFADDAVSGTFTLSSATMQSEPIQFPPTAETLKQHLLAIGVFKKESSFDVVMQREFREYDIFTANPGEYYLEINDENLRSDGKIPTFATVLNLGGMIGDEELQHLCFFTIGDGKKVKQDMKVRISPANVERQRYGSIVGHVTDVSAYPVTSEGVLALTGNQEVASALLEKGGTILVTGALDKDPDTPGRYAWTSKGYDGPITAGTTTTCRITTEERPPITFVVPLLRKWIAGEGDDAPPI